MPTRRIMELVILTDIAIKPVFGMARLWAHKTLGENQPGTFIYHVASVVVIFA